MGMDTPASEAGLRWDRVLQSRELRARLTFTIGALLLWRLLHLVPLPGIDPEVMAATLSRYGMINRGNVIALGLTPFVAVWAFCEGREDPSGRLDRSRSPICHRRNRRIPGLRRGIRRTRSIEASRKDPRPHSQNAQTATNGIRPSAITLPG